MATRGENTFEPFMYRVSPRSDDQGRLRSDDQGRFEHAKFVLGPHLTDCVKAKPDLQQAIDFVLKPTCTAIEKYETSKSDQQNTYDSDLR